MQCLTGYETINFRKISINRNEVRINSFQGLLVYERSDLRLMYQKTYIIPTKLNLSLLRKDETFWEGLVI